MSDCVSVPELRFAEFNGSWINNKLGWCVTLISGQHLAPSEYTKQDNDTPYFTGPSDFTNEAKSITKWSLAPSKIAEKGDVLITVKGNGVGELWFLTFSEVAMGRQLMAIRATTCSGELLFQLLGTRKQQYEALASGNLIPGLSRSDILDMRFFLPQLPEQQKIAAFLGSVDNKLSKLRRKCKLLETWKRGLMQKIFSQQLRFTQERGTAFPDWERKSLGDVASVIGGGTPDTSVAEYWEGDIQWFTPSEIKKKYLFDSKRTITDSGLNHSSAKLLSIGTLLLSTRATVGDVGIATKECSTNQGFQSLVMKDDNKNEFWFYWIIKNKKELLRRSAGSTFLEIGKSEVVKIHVRRPCPEEQQKIADFLSSVDKKIEAVTNKITQTETFKKGLLQKMFV